MPVEKMKLREARDAAKVNRPQNLLRLNSQDTMKARIGYMRDERRGS